MTSPSAPLNRSLWHDRRFRTSRWRDALAVRRPDLRACAAADRRCAPRGRARPRSGCSRLPSGRPTSVAFRRQLGRPAEAAKRPLLIGADLGRAIVLASVPVAYAVDALTLGHLFIVTSRRNWPVLLLDVAQLSSSPGRSQPVPEADSRQRLPLRLVRRRAGGRPTRSASHCARPRVPRRRARRSSRLAVQFAVSACESARSSHRGPAPSARSTACASSFAHPYTAASLGCATTLQLLHVHRPGAPRPSLRAASWAFFGGRDRLTSASARSAVARAVRRPDSFQPFRGRPDHRRGRNPVPAPIAFPRAHRWPRLGRRRFRVGGSTSSRRSGDALVHVTLPTRLDNGVTPDAVRRPCERARYDDQLRHFPPLGAVVRRSAWHSLGIHETMVICRGRRLSSPPFSAHAVADPTCPKARRAGTAACPR